MRLPKSKAPRGTLEALSSGGSSTRQLVALVVALLIAVALSPVGAQAAQVVSAIITDPAGTNQAHVDADGNLNITSTDDPGRMAFDHHASRVFLAGMTEISAGVIIPVGTRLVITYVSGGLNLPTGQTPETVGLLTSAGGNGAQHTFVPSLVGTNGVTDYFRFSHDTLVYADSDQGMTFFARRADTVGEGGVFLSLSGYLIDCSVATCN